MQTLRDADCDTTRPATSPPCPPQPRRRTLRKFHNYSFGNILEIARQKPDATRVAGQYAWNQLGRKVSKGQKGIRILAPMIWTRKKKDGEAAKSNDPAAVNKPM